MRMEKILMTAMLKHSAFCLAISTDRKYLAVGAERWVRILSFPEMKLLQKLPIRHASSMVFLKDHNSLFVVSTTGEMFLWRTAGMERLGRWPVSLWSENPLFCCGSDYVALAHDGGVCVLHLPSMQCRDVYSCPDSEPRIAGCRDGKLHIITIPYKKRRGGIVYAVVDVQGNVHSQIPADRKLNGRHLSRPALLDDGRIALFQGSNRWCSNSALCTIDLHGHVIESHTVPEGYSCCDCDTVAASGRYIAFCHEISGGVTIYNQTDLSLVGQISDLELRQGSEVNPPANLLFVSDEELLVGTWERLFLYRIMPVS